MAIQYGPLYRQILAERQRQYDAAIASRQYTPFLYPWDTLPAIYLLFAIAVAPRVRRPLARTIRYTSFLLVVLHFAYIGSHRRTLSFAGGYMMGIAGAWGVIMSAGLLLFNDVAIDFRRLETRPVDPTGKATHGNEMVSSSAVDTASSIDLTRRKVPGVYTATDTKQLAPSGRDQPATQPYVLTWQGFPHGSNWFHVVDWATDLITNFRGVNWNHRIQTAGEIDAPIPPKPNNHASTAGGKDVSRPIAVPQRTLRSLQLRTLQEFIITYLLLDFLKTTMITDTYFLGLGSLHSPTPWPWLARVNDQIPFATRCVRLLTCMAAVITALTFIFSLSPLFFTIVLPSVMDISKITKSPLLEPWMYPPQWYPLTTSVARSGLAGFWGKFWHQMFRYGISEPSRVLIERLGLDRRGTAARTMQLLIGFLLSGSIHAAGSYTSFSLKASHPLSPFIFFLSQAFGVLLQSSLVKALHAHLPQTKALPQAVRQVTNLVLAALCLYFTGPLLANDFARCGIWLFEPLPVSPLRGLGFGPGGKDDGWWTWYREGTRWMAWWQGERWWQRGLAIY